MQGRFGESPHQRRSNSPRRFAPHLSQRIVVTRSAAKKCIWLQVGDVGHRPGATPGCDIMKGVSDRGPAVTEFEPQFNTLVDIYTQSIHRFADRPLFGTKIDSAWHWMTYREFGDRVQRALAGIAGLGVGKGDRVAIISDNRAEWAVAAYAAYGLGAAVVPMYESQLDKDWKYILGDCGARVLFVADAEIADRVVAFRDDLGALEHVVVFGGAASGAISFSDLLNRDPAPTGPTQVDPKEIAGFVYTSGTTGTPKGVLLSHANIANNVSAIHAVFPLEPNDRSLSFLPFAHSFGQTVELHGMFSMGASLAFAESVSTIVENLSEVEPTMLVAVPRVFNGIHDGLRKRMAETGGIKQRLFLMALANEDRRRRHAAAGRSSLVANLLHGLYDRLVFAKVRAAFGGRLKYAISGGASLSLEVAEFINSLGIDVYEGYGLTETSPIVAANTPDARRIGTVGKPVPGVRVEIDTTISDDPHDGEIIVYGHNVMQGYYGLPDENDKVFTADGGLRTGDLGRFDDDGFLMITGRVKEQYKLENGKYVVPTLIEEKLLLSPLIANVMVYGDNRPHNVALVVPDDDALERWAADRSMDASGRAALLAHPDVNAMFLEEVDRHQAGIKGYEKVRALALLPEDFTIENGMLTQTLKVKRRVALARYDDEIEALYS